MLASSSSSARERAACRAPEGIDLDDPEIRYLPIAALALTVALMARERRNRTSSPNAAVRLVPIRVGR
ncbi:MAG: hypothetical protein ACK4V1_06680 [Burkholderiaceae bacterium]